MNPINAISTGLTIIALGIVLWTGLFMGAKGRFSKEAKVREAAKAEISGTIEWVFWIVAGFIAFAQATELVLTGSCLFQTIFFAPWHIAEAVIDLVLDLFEGGGSIFTFTPPAQ